MRGHRFFQPLGQLAISQRLSLVTLRTRAFSLQKLYDLSGFAHARSRSCIGHKLEKHRKADV